MCIAGESAERTEDPRSDERKRFRVFLFIFAKSILHELGHMFVTFLGRGSTGTPLGMNVQLVDRPQSTEGEAGRYLENLVFGGFVSVLRNPAEGDNQVCSYLPALIESLACELIHFLGRRMLPH